MTTNQTIDGVPRELLDTLMFWLVRANERSENDIPELKELRALLDAPADMFVDPLKSCDLCGHECKAAQPHGEPVEIGYIEHSREFESEFAPVINRLIWTMPPDQRHKIPQRYKVMLYAEQPAPTGGLGVHHVLGAIHNVPGFPGVKGNHIHDLTALLNGVLADAKQPAPVAVLPERLQQVLKFLDGAENLDGHWFGEPHPSGRPYWWRNELSKALAETNLFAKQQ